MTNLVLLQTKSDIIFISLILIGFIGAWGAIQYLKSVLLTTWYFKALDSETDVYIHGSFELVNKDLTGARKKIESYTENRGVKVLAVSKYTGPWQQNTWYCALESVNRQTTYGQYSTPADENTPLRAIMYLNEELKDSNKEVFAIATTYEKLTNEINLIL